MAKLAANRTRSPADVHFRGHKSDRRIRVRHESRGFSPGDGSIAGLTAWYDFSDLTTLFQDTARTNPVTADAQVIKGMTDKSGAAIHLSEATNGPAYKAAIQNGKSVSRYDGINDVLSGAAAQTTTVYTMIGVLVVSGGAGTTREIFGCAGAASGYGFRAVSTNNRGQVLPGVAECADNATTASWEIWVARHSAGASTFYVNGGTAIALTNAASNPAAPSGASTYVGGSFGAFHNGDVGECLLYNSTLSLADVNTIGAYLGTKWGITWTTAT